MVRPAWVERQERGVIDGSLGHGVQPWVLGLSVRTCSRNRSVRPCRTGPGGIRSRKCVKVADSGAGCGVGSSSCDERGGSSTGRQAGLTDSPGWRCLARAGRIRGRKNMGGTLD